MLNTITKLRYPDGTEVAFEDWTDQPLYSTCEIEHGATRNEINLFQYTVGGTVPAASSVAVTQRTADERDTNMSQAGTMASTEEFLVYAIKPEVFTLENSTQGNFTSSLAPQNATGEPIPSPVQYGILNEALILILEISMKRYAQAGFGYFNTGFGPFGSANSGVSGDAAGKTYGAAGLPSQEAVRSFVIPQHMGGQEKFRVQLLNPTGQAINVGNAEQGAQTVSGGGAGSTNPNVFVRIRVLLDGLHKRPVS